MNLFEVRQCSLNVFIRSGHIIVFEKNPAIAGFFLPELFYQSSPDVAQRNPGIVKSHPGLHCISSGLQKSKVPESPRF